MTTSSVTVTRLVVWTISIKAGKLIYLTVKSDVALQTILDTDVNKLL